MVFLILICFFQNDTGQEAEKHDAPVSPVSPSGEMYLL